jgi:hypothetical protein
MLATEMLSHCSLKVSKLETDKTQQSTQKETPRKDKEIERNKKTNWKAKQTERKAEAGRMPVKSFR